MASAVSATGIGLEVFTIFCRMLGQEVRGFGQLLHGIGDMDYGRLDLKTWTEIRTKMRLDKLVFRLDLLDHTEIDASSNTSYIFGAFLGGVMREIICTSRTLVLRRRAIIAVSATGPRRRGGLGGGVSIRLDGLLIKRSTDGLGGRTTRADDEGAGVAVVLVTMANSNENGKGLEGAEPNSHAAVCGRLNRLHTQSGNRMAEAQMGMARSSHVQETNAPSCNRSL
ncbi:uncharacterized protein PHALS_04709, partial [Plasmopara halstedii]